MPPCTVTSISWSTALAATCTPCTASDIKCRWRPTIDRPFFSLRRCCVVISTRMRFSWKGLLEGLVTFTWKLRPQQYHSDTGVRAGESTSAATVAATHFNATLSLPLPRQRLRMAMDMPITCRIRPTMVDVLLASGRVATAAKSVKYFLYESFRCDTTCETQRQVGGWSV